MADFGDAITKFAFCYKSPDLGELDSMSRTFVYGCGSLRHDVMEVGMMAMIGTSSAI